MRLTLDDNGSRQRARVGDLIELQLDETPTTGFRWALQEPGSAWAVSEDRMAPGTAAPGAGGRRILVLRALQPGAHALRLSCQRSWEGPASAVARFEVAFTVD